jgi:hypothetical protein
MPHLARSVLLLLSLALAACGGEVVGLGSLLVQGLQMASGGATPPASGGRNTTPFTRQDNAQERQALDDVSSRQVSQSCVAQKDVQKDAQATPDDAAQSPAPAFARRQCGFRDVCLPGHVRPVRMLICEAPMATAAAQLERASSPP